MEIRKLLWLMALIFSIFIFIRYYERPYGYFMSSLLSFGENGLKSETDHSLGGRNHLNDDHSYVSRGFTAMNSSSTIDDQLVTTNNSSDQEIDFLHSATNIAPISIENEDTFSPVNSPQPSSVERDFYKFFNGSSKTRFEGQPDQVVPISAMNDMLHQSHLAYESVKPLWPSQVDEELLNTRKLIVDAGQKAKKPSDTDVNVVYRNYSEFLRSYELMERTLKIYIYTEGEGPVFQKSELRGIYSSEGWFKKQLKENKHFVTRDADRAHLFYLPFSSHLLEKTFYIPKTNYKSNMTMYLRGYLQNITTKHRFWNRTGGADHFLVACHDWAPGYTSKLMRNSIRALCNAQINGGGKFEFRKDVSLPEISIGNAKKPLKDVGGKPPSQRSILAFFSGRMHGYLRPMFLKYWEDKDPDMKFFGNLHVLNSHETYVQFMKGSKYCISVRGYAPYTPRIVEAIHYECVPVIIADNYVPPFFETLNWESFAIFVPEKDFPNLKNILLSISEQTYIEMQERVKQVQKHFLWNIKPVKHDVFHMILHAIWYNRVFQMS